MYVCDNVLFLSLRFLSFVERHAQGCLKENYEVIYVCPRGPQLFLFVCLSSNYTWLAVSLWLLSLSYFLLVLVFYISHLHLSVSEWEQFLFQICSTHGK